MAHRDGAVLISGEALPLLYRATLALIARRRRDGLAASPLLIEARRTLYRACIMSRSRHEDADPDPPGSWSAGHDDEDLIGLVTYAKDPT